MSRRNNRNRHPARIEKAQRPAITPSATFTGDQVAALLAAQSAPQTSGGFSPLPRMDPQVAFGPGLPLIPAQIDPVRSDTGRPEPRFNEYPVSSNLPGVTDRLVPWKVLRDAAAAGGIPRRCIEIRKAEIATLSWAIGITKTAVAQAEADSPSSSRADIEADLRKRLGPEIARCTTFWERPDPGQDEDWTEWISKVLEEHLVLDAIAIYPRLTYGGDLYALECLDGSTIKVLRDYRGGKPAPPGPAYQQELWGFPRGEYTADTDATGNILNPYAADTLIYKRRNVRSTTPYGFSAVEQALEDLDVWLRRRQWIRSEFTDGTVPAGLLRNTASNGWTPQQVLEYETALNDVWSGSTLERHRMRILPPGFEPEFPPDVAERYKPEYDLFLLKQLAGHFSTTIAELNFSEPGGLGSSGYHEGQADIKERTATMPTYRWLQKLITQISRRHLRMPPELEFKILGLEEEDEAAADTVAGDRVGSGRMTYNEDRDRLGLPRYTFPEADMPIIKTGRGVIFLEGASKMAAPGETVSPVDAPSNTDTDGDGVADRFEVEDAGADTQPAGVAKDGSRQPEAVKAEVAAFRRWVRRNPAPARPFRAEVLTKADAPPDIATDSRIVFATPEVTAGPKGGDRPGHWPGWDRDQDTAELWAHRIQQALVETVDCERLAERWLARELVKADEPDTGSGEWAVTLAAAFLTAEDAGITGAVAGMLNGIWAEGWAIGAVSAATLLGGRSHAKFPWAVGDSAAAGRTLTSAAADALRGFTVRSRGAIRDIAEGRMRTFARILAGAKAAGLSARQLARALRDALKDGPWARMLALTELVRASSEGARMAYTAAGVTNWQWMTEPGACPDCLGNEAADPRPIGQAWPDGSELPPAHPRCRCSCAPM